MNEPKNDELWGFIARALWTGPITYLVFVGLAFLRDVSRKSIVTGNTLALTLTKSRFSPYAWNEYYIRIYRDTQIFYLVEVFRLIINLAVCVVYIIGTYTRNVLGYITIINRIGASFFMLDIVSEVFSAESAISSVSSLTTFFDAFSIPSLLMASGPNQFLNFSFLRAIQAYGAFSRLEKRLLVQVMSSKRLFAKLGMQCITLFYTLASAIQLLEVPGDLLSVNFRDTWLQFGEWNFFNSVYFVVVTLSTVGYGDLSPSTVQGRLFTLMIIVIGIVIFTSVIGEIVEQSTRGRGSGWFVKNPNARHVIVCGNPTLSSLVLFVSEFYSDTRESNMTAKIVVLVEDPTWSDTDWFQHIAKNSFLQARLTFLQGCLRNPVDTQRAKLPSADAVFFLTSPSTGEDPSLQDIRTVMNILAVRNARTDIPIYAQTLLEGSNLQTNVALKKATTFSKGTYFRDSKSMRPAASYQGLFHAVLQAEVHDFAKVRLKRDSKEVEDAIEHHKKVRQGGDMLSCEGKPVDLERSSLICLQEIQMALIAGNIRVNGLATLLSNMYLDIPAEKPCPNDPSWLWEYQMGSSCALQYAIIPEQLHGIALKKIAIEMFHTGLVLVGTTDIGHKLLHPILDTDTFLRKGDIGIFLTYLQQDHVAAALHVVASRHKLGRLLHSVLPSISSADDLKHTSSGLDPMTKRLSGISSTSMKIEDAFSTPNLTQSLSTVKATRHREEDQEDIVGGDLLDSQKRRSYEKCSDGYIPDALSGHVIVAIEGDAALENLALFLKKLWERSDRRSMRNARRARVVVIHPSITDKYRKLFTRHERESLFFVEGSPSSADPWAKARLKTAKSVATMADYTRPWSISDARTIFTLLTLDVNTAFDHDLFICSELVDEKSLEFMREPSHPRRRGATLGQMSHETSANVSRSQFSASPAHSSVASPEISRLGEQQDAVQSMPAAVLEAKEEKLPGADVPGELPPKTALGTELNINVPSPPDEDSSTNSRGAANPVHAVLTSAEHLKKSAVAAVVGKGHGSVKSGGSRHSKQLRRMSFRLPEPENLVPGDGAATVDPTNKPGAARARRGSLFSRSRYASGELLIHSSAITLLVREYVEPGFINFFSDMLGTVQPTPGLKIRLVQIPKTLFRVDRGAVFRNGQLFLPYISVFRSLIRHGATPLGIYRSGDAPVRVPGRQRHRRGMAIVEELTLYWKGLARAGTASVTKARGSLFQHLRGIVEAVSPQHMRETQGRHEINGGQQDSSSSEEYDSDWGTSEEDDEKENMEGRLKGLPVDKHQKNVEDNTAPGPVGDAGQNHATSPALPQKGDVFEKHMEAGKGEYEVPGGCKYKESPPAQNLLPYVFTMPEPCTLCAETDGIYILCHPSLELSDRWTEAIANEGEDESQDQ